jgi:hypothetical protein
MHRTSRQKALQSYDEYWRRLCQYFSLFARRRPNDNVYEQMRRVQRPLSPQSRKANIHSSFSIKYFLPNAKYPGEQRRKTL